MSELGAARDAPNIVTYSHHLAISLTLTRLRPLFLPGVPNKRNVEETTRPVVSARNRSGPPQARRRMSSTGDTYHALSHLYSIMPLCHCFEPIIVVSPFSTLYLLKCLPSHVLRLRNIALLLIHSQSCMANLLDFTSLPLRMPSSVRRRGRRLAVFSAQKRCDSHRFVCPSGPAQPLPAVV